MSAKVTASARDKRAILSFGSAAAIGAGEPLTPEIIVGRG